MLVSVRTINRRFFYSIQLDSINTSYPYVLSVRAYDTEFVHIICILYFNASDHEIISRQNILPQIFAQYRFPLFPSPAFTRTFLVVEYLCKTIGLIFNVILGYLYILDDFYEISPVVNETRNLIFFIYLALFDKNK